MSTIITGDASLVSNSLTKTINGATNATPIVVQTTTAHLFATGDTVVISGVTGNTAANGTWTIVVVDSTHFNLVGSVGSGAYVSGGTAVDISLTPQFTIPSDLDTLDAASINVAIEALADRTQFLARTLGLNFSIRKATFTANVWTIPYNAVIGFGFGFGGGGGGAGGNGGSGGGTTTGNNGGGSGGGGALMVIQPLVLIPGATATRTIGAGGTGGTGGTGGDGNDGVGLDGNDGGSTTLVISGGATYTFRGGQGGNKCSMASTFTYATGVFVQAGGVAGGGGSPRLGDMLTKLTALHAALGEVSLQFQMGGGPGWGASGYCVTAQGTTIPNGFGSVQGFAGGTSGTTGVIAGGNRGGSGGGGGGAGPAGAGGNGGNGGSNTGVGSPGSAAAANTGAGGGAGGGAANSGTVKGGDGAAGGSGNLDVYYVALN